MSILDDAKELVSLVQKVGDRELYRKIVELEGEIVEMSRKNLGLEQELAKAKSHRAIIDTLRFDSPFYVSDDGKDLYCPRCREVDGFAVHVVRRNMLTLWICPQCERQYSDTRSGNNLSLA
jgi:Zn finger protein HypA/HybF involved in hydrogenase expression